MRIKATIIAATFLVLSFTFSKRKKFIPPGTIQISETFFADETEISNFSYQEFEQWTKRKYGLYSAEHLAVLPDTLVWRTLCLYGDPSCDYYFRHPALKDYPVVGVSHEQALAFCKWRTERVKESYAIKYHLNINLEYRLPTKEEWELISNNGINIFIGKENGKNEKGQWLLNCIHDGPGVKDSTQFSFENICAPVYSYWKNNFGIFNVFGNVAEMVSEKGICKGGSWRHRLEECRAGKDISYDEPKPWLGFRCVCILKRNSE